jgi:hypothetical protein
MRRIGAALAVGTVLGAAGAAADPAINGVEVNATVANGSSNAAIGAFATARQAIGVVNGVPAVNGALDNTTIANGNANLSTGMAHGGLPDRGRGRSSR